MSSESDSEVFSKTFRVRREPEREPLQTVDSGDGVLLEPNVDVGEDVVDVTDEDQPDPKEVNGKAASLGEEMKEDEVEEEGVGVISPVSKITFLTDAPDKVRLPDQRFTRKSIWLCDEHGRVYAETKSRDKYSCLCPSCPSFLIRDPYGSEEPGPNQRRWGFTEHSPNCTKDQPPIVHFEVDPEDVNLRSDNKRKKLVDANKFVYEFLKDHRARGNQKMFQCVNCSFTYLLHYGVGLRQVLRRLDDGSGLFPPGAHTAHPPPAHQPEYDEFEPIDFGAREEEKPAQTIETLAIEPVVVEGSKHLLRLDHEHYLYSGESKINNTVEGGGGGGMAVVLHCENAKCCGELLMIRSTDLENTLWKRRSHTMECRSLEQRVWQDFDTGQVTYCILKDEHRKSKDPVRIQVRGPDGVRYLPTQRVYHTEEGRAPTKRLKYICWRNHIECKAEIRNFENTHRWQYLMKRQTIGGPFLRVLHSDEQKCVGDSNIGNYEMQGGHDVLAVRPRPTTVGVVSKSDIPTATLPAAIPSTSKECFLAPLPPASSTLPNNSLGDMKVQPNNKSPSDGLGPIDGQASGEPQRKRVCTDTEDLRKFWLPIQRVDPPPIADLAALTISESHLRGPTPLCFTPVPIPMDQTLTSSHSPRPPQPLKSMADAAAIADNYYGAEPKNRWENWDTLKQEGEEVERLATLWWHDKEYQKTLKWSTIPGYEELIGWDPLKRTLKCRYDLNSPTLYKCRILECDNQWCSARNGGLCAAHSVTSSRCFFLLSLWGGEEPRKLLRPCSVRFPISSSEAATLTNKAIFNRWFQSCSPALRRRYGPLKWKMLKKVFFDVDRGGDGDGAGEGEREFQETRSAISIITFINNSVHRKGYEFDRKVVNTCVLTERFKMLLKASGLFWTLETRAQYVERRVKEERGGISAKEAGLKFDKLMANARTDVHRMPHGRACGMSRLCFKKGCKHPGVHKWPHVYAARGRSSPQKANNACGNGCIPVHNHPENVYHTYNGLNKDSTDRDLSACHYKKGDKTSLGLHLAENDMDPSRYDNENNSLIEYAKPSKEEAEVAETVVILARAIVTSEFLDMPRQINAHLPVSQPLTKDDWLDMQTHIAVRYHLLAKFWFAKSPTEVVQLA